MKKDGEVLQEKSMMTEECKRAFPSYLRHELFTQINAIIGYSEMLLEEISSRGELTQGWRADLDNIRATGVGLFQFLENSRSNPGSPEFVADLLFFIRTLITTIVGYADLLLEDADKQQPLESLHDLEIIRNAGHTLVESLQDYFQPDKKQCNVSNLSGALAEVFPLMRNAVNVMQSRKGRQALTGRLLVVDDDAVSRDLLVYDLVRDGYKVDIAEGGRQGLEMIRTGGYDLVILDVVMPEVNGYQVLEQLQADGILVDLPVVIISSLLEMADIARCIEIGAMDYLPRKFNSALFKARISASLENKRLREQQRNMLKERQLAEQAALTASEKKFRQLISGAQVGIFRTTIKGKVLEANPALLQVLGYANVDELNQEGLNRIYVDPADRERMITLLHKSPVRGFETLMKCKSGEVIYASLSAQLIPSEDVNEPFLEGTLEDITERKKNEEELRIAATVFESQEGMMVTDARSVILRVNHAFTEITGYTNREAVGQTPRLLRSGHQNADFYVSMRTSIQRRGSWHGEIWNRRKNGEIYPEWLIITGVADAAGNVTHYVGVFSDITERKLVEEKINYLAYHDKLTGLPNRSLFYDRLSQGLSHARRNGAHLALLFLDLDGFKSINDDFGHQVGDDVLKTTANRLLSCVRDVDTIGRLGGDEFAIVLGELESSSDVNFVAEKIIKKLMGKVLLRDGGECSVGVSIGIAMYPENGAEIDSLVSAADMAMYASKSAGKGTYSFAKTNTDNQQWVIFDNNYLLDVPEIDEQHQKLAQLLNHLNTAVKEKKAEPLVELAFDEFIECVRSHFEDEERMMDEVGYESDAHKNEHRLMLAESGEMKRHFFNGGESMVLQSLKGWLVGHVLHSDSEFAAFWRAKHPI